MSKVLDGKILVVDDMKSMVRILKKFLEEIGFTNIDVATNGVEALELIKSEDYTLIISDWNMEPMTGLELLKEVRGDPRTEKVPFIMVTAESKPNNVLAAQAAGVSNYVVKPFTQVTIRKKIGSVIGPLD